MKTTIIQTNLTWEDKRANLDRISAFLDTVEKDTQLVVLPEMFTTAFSMNVHALAESMDGMSVRWMLDKSSEKNFALCGSLIIKENGAFYNRMLFVKPSGEVTVYDKKHLHAISGEDKAYSQGNRRVTCYYNELCFNLQVCYDLRFPVWSRNRGDTDVIIYSANWPAVRNYAWKSLLIARAIENQCYVIGANRTGDNPDGTEYTGESLIIGPKGEILASLPASTEGILTATLSKEMLVKYRNDMPVWRDADSFTLDSEA